MVSLFTGGRVSGACTRTNKNCGRETYVLGGVERKRETKADEEMPGLKPVRDRCLILPNKTRDPGQGGGSFWGNPRISLFHLKTYPLSGRHVLPQGGKRSSEFPRLPGLRTAKKGSPQLLRAEWGLPSKERRKSKRPRGS